PALNSTSPPSRRRVSAPIAKMRNAGRPRRPSVGTRSRRRCRRRWPWARLRHQFVTARFGDQDGRAGSVPLDLLPQPVDVRLERVRCDAGVIAPDLLQQGLARNRTLAGAIKIAQDRGLLLREPHLVALGIEQDLRARAERVGANGEY